MSRSTAVEEQEEEDRARGQVGNGDGSPPPPMRSMSREDSCASAAATDDYNRLTRLLENSQTLFAPPPVYDSTEEKDEDAETETGKMFSMSPPTSLSPPTSSSPLDDCSVPRRLRTRSDGVDIRQHEKLRFKEKDEARVLVLYTGGTIGMVRNTEGALAPFPHAMEDRIRATITMHDEEYSKSRFMDIGAGLETLDEEEEAAAAVAVDESGDNARLNKSSLLPLVLPHVPDHRRVIYAIYEYDPLLDSSNMTMDDWIVIAKDIKRSYEHFDGFVVLHGTDTLAYTASALSFMLEHLGKPVIVTGSQIPCFETRSDGRDNFVGALILAGNYNIPEVCVYFRHQLMRGNRTVKIDSGDLDAFNSPNMRPLVKAGIDFEVDYRAIHRPNSIEKFCVHTRLDRHVVLLRLFPSISGDTIGHFLKPPIKGVVLQCYGAGNVPSNRSDILTLIKEASDRGVIIMSTTQCVSGGVSGLYATGKALLDAGVIAGSDITPEAALTKLSYVISKKAWDIEKKRLMMQTNINGEMTVLAKKDVSRDYGGKEAEMDLISSVAKSLSVNTSGEMDSLRDVLYPSLLCAAVYKGNTVADIENIIGLGADVASGDYDRRTPLHIAAAEGKTDMAEYLMRCGAGVHVKDRNGHSPLRCAADAGFEGVVRLLVDCGAHLQTVGTDLGELLCDLARRGKRGQLKCYKLAGANMDARNLGGSTALLAAVETGQSEVVEFLLGEGADVAAVNCFNMTPETMAKAANRPRIAKMLSAAHAAAGTNKSEK